MFTNIAAYKFAALTDLPRHRARLQKLCRECKLKGTILLSPEGINLFIAGDAHGVEMLLVDLRAMEGLSDLVTKESFSQRQPFTRMLVRLKKEIIAFGVEGIDPAVRSSPKVSARQLKEWIDQGRKLTLLDTRNDYEIRMGTFRGAVPAGVSHFRDFPAAVAKLPAQMKDETVVMFCTGGIRCEKAGPFMQREGFRDVYQLDGGILKYFEECAGAHYDGDCFVFDRRVCLDPQLRQTNAAVCFACQMPLTEGEQKDPRYQPGKSCPFCFASQQTQARAS